MPHLGTIERTARNKAIHDGFLEGLSVSDLSNCFGMPKPTIHHILRRVLTDSDRMARQHKLLEEEVGNQYGWLTVVSEHLPSHKGGRRTFECRCVCGTTVTRDKYAVTRGDIKSCGCYTKVSKGRPAPGQRSPLYRGHGEISGNVWSHIKEGAKTRNLELSVTIEYIWQLFLDQDRKCALSGKPLVFKERRGSTASLDRINNSKGYVEGNVQWLHRDVNLMKHAYEQSYFIETCQAVALCCSRLTDVHNRDANSGFGQLSSPDISRLSDVRQTHNPYRFPRSDSSS